jgi:hypothetical protein
MKFKLTQHLTPSKEVPFSQMVLILGRHPMGAGAAPQKELPADLRERKNRESSERAAKGDWRLGPRR